MSLCLVDYSLLSLVIILSLGFCWKIVIKSKDNFTSIFYIYGDKNGNNSNFLQKTEKPNENLKINMYTMTSLRVKM